MDDPTTDDTRSKDAKQFDATMDVLLAVVHRLDTLLADEKRGNNSNSFQVSGGGFASIVCACISLACLFGMLGFAWMVNSEMTKQTVEHTADIHDLRAWRDIHQGRIDKLDAWKTAQQEKAKQN